MPIYKIGSFTSGNRLGVTVELENHVGIGQRRAFVEVRRHPRYKLEAGICIYPRGREVVRGQTVDISQSGISAMLRVEVPLGEVVRLKFSVPAGEIEVHALVRQRNAFRYGFQFVEDSSVLDLIGRTCRESAMAQATKE